MIARQELNRFLEMEPKFDDIMCSLRATVKQPKGILKEAKEVVALMRKFNQEVIEPYALDIDRKVQEDPNHIPIEIVEKANEWGFFTMWIPKIFGGKGYSFATLCNFAEEVGTACLGLANLVGVHYLGISGLMATWNARVAKKICEDVIAGEKNKTPCILSLAVTEPSAGTDVEEKDLLEKGTVACHCKRVAGGYEVTGTKVFISNAAVSTWHIIIAYADLQRPTETSVFFMVKAGTQGFSVGRQEKKMGQKGCPVNELIFDNCFIPDNQVCIDEEQMKSLSMSAGDVYQFMMDYIVSTTRPAVGAFGTAAARAALEATLAYASETKVAGKLLINHEWVQCRLADMYKNVVISRLLASEASYTNGLEGYYKLLHWKPLYYYYKIIPNFLIRKMVLPIMEMSITTKILRKVMFDWMKDKYIHRTSGWASISKFAGTDAGVQNCQMAIEIMGQSGLRQDAKVEKCLRDAKLLQIYEGTNQLNRLNTYKCLIQRCAPQSVVFDE